MTEIISIVKDIRKDTASNGKPFYKVYLESGETLIAWAFSKIENIKKGEQAKFIVSKKGNFIHIEAAELIGEVEDNVEPWDEPEEPTEEDVAEPVKKTIKKTIEKSPVSRDDYWDEKFKFDIENSARIGRQACLNSAAAYLTYCAACDPKQKPVTEEDVIAIAKRFETYAKSGK